MGSAPPMGKLVNNKAEYAEIHRTSHVKSQSSEPHWHQYADPIKSKPVWQTDFESDYYY